eukprot:g1160.t1
MGKSIRSKIKRKWRSRKRQLVNKPMEDESQRQVTWRLQQSLKKSLEAEKRTSTLTAIGGILSGKPLEATAAMSADMEKEANKESAKPAYVSNSESEKLAGHSCGAAIGEERPFAFVERTWEVERPPPGYQLEQFSELISKKMTSLKGAENDTPKDENSMEEDIEMKRGYGKAASARAAAKKRRRKLSAAPYRKRGNNYGKKGR